MLLTCVFSISCSNPWMEKILKPLYKENEVEEHKHEWGPWMVTTGPGETTDGAETRICALDSSHQETRTLYATGTPGLDFELINNTAYRVRKGSVTGGAVHIPAYWRGASSNYADYRPVTEIGREGDTPSNGAFYNIGITSVTIPSTVTVIGSCAFTTATTSQLQTLTFAAGSRLRSIGMSAFNACQQLSGDITLPEGLTTIGDSAFELCQGITSIYIPASVTAVGSETFRNWLNSQTIFVRGYVNILAANDAWGAAWQTGSSALLRFWNGSSWI